MEMVTIEPRVKILKRLGTDMEMAIYNGFSLISEQLQLLLCVFHMKKKDEEGTKSVIFDIYGVKYSNIQECGLANSNTKEEFNDRLSRNGIPYALVSIPGSTKKEELCLKNM